MGRRAVRENRSASRYSPSTSLVGQLQEDTITIHLHQSSELRCSPDRRTSLEELAVVLRQGWHADTSWIDDWDAQCPARGQCGSTALVLNDLRGGELMRGLVDEGSG